jgi:hypothetical protein
LAELTISTDSVQAIELKFLFLMVHNYAVSLSNSLTLYLTLRNTFSFAEHHKCPDANSLRQVMTWRALVRSSVKPISSGSLAKQIKGASDLLKGLAIILPF